MQSHQPSVRILSLHGVVPRMPVVATFEGGRSCLIETRDFERLIAYCASRYRCIGVSQLNDYLEEKTSKPAVAITFDDALASLVDYAIPILAKYSSKATVFVTTDWTKGQQIPPVFLLERDLWTRIPCALSVTTFPDNLSLEIRSRQQLPKVFDQLWSHLFVSTTPPLLLKPNQVKIDGQPWRPTNPDEPRDFWMPASVSSLKRCVETGLIEIGSHGVTHAPWPSLSSQDLRHELNHSKSWLESVFQVPVSSCAYPHGRVTPEVAEVASSVYGWAFANRPGLVTNFTDRHLAPRMHMASGKPFVPSLSVAYPRVAGALRRLYRLSQLKQRLTD